MDAFSCRYRSSPGQSPIPTAACLDNQLLLTLAPVPAAAASSMARLASLPGWNEQQRLCYACARAERAAALVLQGIANSKGNGPIQLTYPHAICPPLHLNRPHQPNLAPQKHPATPPDLPQL